MTITHVHSESQRFATTKAVPLSTYGATGRFAVLYVTSQGSGHDTAVLNSYTGWTLFSDLGAGDPANAYRPRSWGLFRTLTSSMSDYTIDHNGTGGWSLHVFSGTPGASGEIVSTHEWGYVDAYTNVSLDAPGVGYGVRVGILAPNNGTSVSSPAVAVTIDIDEYSAPNGASYGIDTYSAGASPNFSPNSGTDYTLSWTFVPEETGAQSSQQTKWSNVTSFGSPQVTGTGSSGAIASTWHEPQTFGAPVVVAGGGYAITPTALGPSRYARITAGPSRWTDLELLWDPPDHGNLPAGVADAPIVVHRCQHPTWTPGQLIAFHAHANGNTYRSHFGTDGTLDAIDTTPATPGRAQWCMGPTGLYTYTGITSVMVVDGTLHSWTHNEHHLDGHQCFIGHGTASNLAGYAWTHDDPLIVSGQDLQPTGFRGASGPCVVQLPDGSFVMVYTNRFGIGRHNEIYRATADYPGGPWTVHGSIVQEDPAGPNFYAEAPRLYWSSGHNQWLLTYDTDVGTRFRTSTDTLTWSDATELVPKPQAYLQTSGYRRWYGTLIDETQDNHWELGSVGGFYTDHHINIDPVTDRWASKSEFVWTRFDLPDAGGVIPGASGRAWVVGDIDPVASDNPGTDAVMAMIDSKWQAGDVLVIAGDCIQTDEYNQARFTDFINDTAAVLGISATNRAEMLLAPGDHDVDRAKWQSNFGIDGYAPWGVYYIAGARWIILDSCNPFNRWEPGVSAAQLTWLDGVLAQQYNGPSYAVMHHPRKSSYIGGGPSPVQASGVDLTTGLVGYPWGMDSLSNRNFTSGGTNRCGGYRFIAAETGSIDTITIYWIGAKTNYGEGDGGEYELRIVRPSDGAVLGYAEHVWEHAAVGLENYTYEQKLDDIFPAMQFYTNSSKTVTGTEILTQGVTYDLVVRNVDPDWLNNYAAIDRALDHRDNDGYQGEYIGDTGRNPHVPSVADFGFHYYDYNTFVRTGNSASTRFPIMNINLKDGTEYGTGVMDASHTYSRMNSGPGTKVRMLCNVTGVSGATYVGIRCWGSGTIVGRITDHAGNQIGGQTEVITVGQGYGVGENAPAQSDGHQWYGGTVSVNTSLTACAIEFEVISGAISTQASQNGGPYNMGWKTYNNIGNSEINFGGGWTWHNTNYQDQGVLTAYFVPVLSDPVADTYRDVPEVAPLHERLYNAHVDYIFCGHAPMYEATAKIDDLWYRRPADGYRQILVGTGGWSHDPSSSSDPALMNASDGSGPVILHSQWSDDPGGAFGAVLVEWSNTTSSFTYYSTDGTARHTLVSDPNNTQQVGQGGALSPGRIYPEGTFGYPSILGGVQTPGQRRWFSRGYGGPVPSVTVTGEVSMAATSSLSVTDSIGGVAGGAATFSGTSLMEVTGSEVITPDILAAAVVEVTSVAATNRELFSAVEFIGSSAMSVTGASTAVQGGASMAATSSLIVTTSKKSTTGAAEMLGFGWVYAIVGRRPAPVMTAVAGQGTTGGP